MTLPLPALAAETVRCRGCQRICRRGTFAGYGPECARRRGLIPGRRVAVVSGAADLTLFYINEGVAGMTLKTIPVHVNAAVRDGEGDIWVQFDPGEDWRCVTDGPVGPAKTVNEIEQDYGLEGRVVFVGPGAGFEPVRGSAEERSDDPSKASEDLGFGFGEVS